MNQVEHRPVESALREAALLQAQTTLRSIIDSTADLIWSVDPQAYGLVTFNRSLRDYFLEKHQLPIKPGMRPQDLLPERYAQQWHAFYRRALTGGSFTTEYQVSAGSTVLQLSFNILEEQGKVFGISVFGKDVTEQRRAEAALRGSEERFRQVAETVGDFIWEIDADGLYTYTSPSVQRILGYTPQDLVGKVHFYDLFIPEVREELKSAVFQALAKRQNLRAFVNPNLSKDGRVVHLETSGVAIVDEAGKLMGYRGADTDVTERLKAGEALRESEEKFRSLHETMRDAFASVDLAGRIQEFNSVFQEMLGYSEAELRQMSIRDFTPEKWRFLEDQILRDQVLARGYSEIYEKEYRKKDGTVFPVELHSFLLRDKVGQPSGMWAIVRDITRRSRAQEALRQNEERLRLVLEANSEGVWDWDIKGGNAYFSPRYSGMLGYPSEEFAKNYTSWKALVHPEDFDRVHQAHQDHLHHGKEFCVDLRMLKKSGDWCWIRSRGMVVERDELGNPVRMVGTHMDITSRKEAEDRALESERRFMLMANSAPVLIWIAGTDKLCNFFNQPWLQFTGRTLEQELGQGWVEGVHPDDRDGCVKTYSDAFDARRSFSIEYRLRRHDGQYRWVSDTGVARYDSRQDFAGYIGSCVDITERKQAEAEALRSRQELAHAGRVTTLGELAGSLAHELNQPLTSILSNAQAAQRFLSRKPAELNEVRSILQDIVYEDRRAGEVIARMRAMLKKGEAQMLPLNLDTLIREVLGLIRSELVVRNVAVITHLAPRLPLVRGDRVQLQQVVLNLMMNACDAMNSNPAPKHKLTVKTERLGAGEVQVAVSDTGPGFPRGMIERPFEPFRTTKSHGLGLGLPICRSILSAHGGQLSLANNPDGGATVRFALAGRDKDIP